MAATTTSATDAPADPSGVADDLAPGSLITRDGQVQWAGLLMGPGTPYEIDSAGLTGWEDIPDFDTSDADRPTAHGSWPGSRYAKPRKVAGQMWVLPAAPGDATLATMRALRRALSLADEERWLTVRLHGELLTARARVSQRVLPLDRVYVQQGVAHAAVQWQADDPRRYSADQQTLSTSPPEPETGVVFPLSFPLDFGQATSTGDISAQNTGSAPTQPVITFSGPCSNPTVTEQTTGRRLRYEIALTADDQLAVDTMAGTVTLNGTASRRHTAAADSGPEELFAFAPGDFELSFRPDTSTADARMSVSWRSAEW
jgi:hypothetical protein